MLRRIAILCALWALPAAAQDELLGTWEHSQEGIEGFSFTWEHIDTLEKKTFENATVFYDTLAGQSSRRVTFREDGTAHLNSVRAYDLSDLPDEVLTELKERGLLFDSRTYDGMGTWRTAGDSLWIEYDEFIMYEGDTEVRISEFSAEDFIREQVAGEEVSEEDRAAVEAFYSHFFNLTKEQMEFAGTYQLEGDSLFLTSLGVDGVDRTRAYIRTTAATANPHQLRGAEGQPIDTSAN